ncbi:hypothetical protein LAZ67_3002035 [Cordylochernes scorpioides]|uniref:Reverse transcriptase n=1 Tax=Cordylochernes scorpioides TaxID=51811 RepID=A0ABY6K7Q4_9ARAC|nr:hypothetical protein LAZ67_3002035 [Cordylochernes scorpioides]
MSNCVSTKACLETLLVKVWGPKGSKVVRAVIDSGSSQTYILEHIVKDLGVPIMGEEELDHEIFGGISRHRKGLPSNISVAKEDRQYLRFLWWEEGKQENLRIYKHKRVVFGVTSSPFLLAATLNLHLEQYEREVIPLLKCIYLDNCVNSVTSLEEAQVFQQQSIDLLSPAGFNLREGQMGGPGIVNS